jgi:hypothetical protein
MSRLLVMALLPLKVLQIGMGNIATQVEINPKGNLCEMTVSERDLAHDGPKQSQTKLISQSTAETLNQIIWKNPAEFSRWDSDRCNPEKYFSVESDHIIKQVCHQKDLESRLARLMIAAKLMLKTE